MAYQKCTNCNGSGTILNHIHPTHTGQQSAGQGMSVCPSCNGRGHNGYYVNPNLSHEGATFFEAFTGFSVIAFVVLAIYMLSIFYKSESPFAVNIMNNYIGPNGYISKDMFFIAFSVSALVIGILFRNILKWIMLLAGILWVSLILIDKFYY